MRWDLGDAQIYQRPHRMDSGPVGMDAGPREGVAWGRVTSYNGAVEDLTVHQDKGPATQGMIQGWIAHLCRTHDW